MCLTKVSAACAHVYNVVIFSYLLHHDVTMTDGFRLSFCRTFIFNNLTYDCRIREPMFLRTYPTNVIGL